MFFLTPFLQECECGGMDVPCNCCRYNPYLSSEEIEKNREAYFSKKKSFSLADAKKVELRFLNRLLKRVFKKHK